MKEKIKAEYHSSDFSTLCCLFHLGIEPGRFERNSHAPDKVVVYFKQTVALDQTLRLLRSRQLSVEPVAFLETTREVRGRLRDCA